MSGITNQGNHANELFCIITGADKLGKNDPKGDATLYHQSHGKSIYIEVKKNTYNQVRPYKYCVVVGYDECEKQWYVIPPDTVISLCGTEENKAPKRGQHTTNPMECASLGSVDLSRYDKYKVEKEHLLEAVISAFEQGENNKVYKDYAYNKYVEFEDTPTKINEEINKLKLLTENA